MQSIFSQLFFWVFTIWCETGFLCWMCKQNQYRRGLTLTERRLPFKIDLFALLSVIIPFSIYLLTLAPSVTFFDSGEFITAIHSLGSPHSPGYPLFVQFAKPFTWLPFGNIAYRVNIATAISAGLACFSVYLLVRHLLEEEESVTEKASSDYLKKV